MFECNESKSLKVKGDWSAINVFKWNVLIVNVHTVVISNQVSYRIS